MKMKKNNTTITLDQLIDEQYGKEGKKREKFEAGYKDF